MSLAELGAALLLIVGAFFFLAGTVGLLRFPDVYTRLHALTKADNLGLGFVGAGLALSAGDLAVALEIGMVWALVLLSGSICCHLIAGAARRGGIRVWRPR
ncbi:monovalent cation/H(+) antiporter subunit G [Sorangium sp. So ce1036]|uniref:monovalent cation/H(+) antiporter subunit G n=1 Tax=Sorangium sp. So ce1036 TaxID=3133328 RepID=UPI003EFC7569